MAFPYKVEFEEIIDLDGLLECWQTNSYLINYLMTTLGPAQYQLINFIVKEGLKDLRGQEISIDDSSDDQYAKPNPDAGIMTPNYTDDDPYARPAKDENGN